jgi:cytochrome c peroxidase
MRPVTLRVLIIGVCLGLLAFAVIGCGSGTTTTTAAAATTTTAAAATTTSAAGTTTTAGATATTAGASTAITAPPAVDARKPLPALERTAGFTDKEWLGKQLFFDPNLSMPPGQACSGCHDPAAGWADPAKDSPTSAGNVPGLFGKRNSPSAAYASFSPDFRYDAITKSYVGGQFWDGRAKNLADQAKGPILNPLEMSSANKQSVLDAVKAGPYADLFKQVWGATVFDQTETAYGNLAASIAEYEKTSEVNTFSSKYDDVLRGAAALTEQEKRGLALFKGKAKCYTCHATTADAASGKVLFTAFGYDNAGVPKNPQNKFYTLDAKANPAGKDFVDLGLGGQLKKPSENGKFKVPSLRNVALTAPYMHNGYFTSLKDVVKFYNTRDVASAGWPAPEVAENMNKKDMGNLKLTDSEIDDIVTFLNTLSDTKFPQVK